ncbi:MAG: hypothetical protein V3V18_13825 [Methylococcales bacterium]
MVNSSFDELTVTVDTAGITTMLGVRISVSSDDAEENVATGKANRGSSDLELVDQGSHNQVVILFAHEILAFRVHDFLWRARRKILTVVVLQ